MITSTQRSASSSSSSSSYSTTPSNSSITNPSNSSHTHTLFLTPLPLRIAKRVQRRAVPPTSPISLASQSHQTLANISFCSSVQLPDSLDGAAQSMPSKPATIPRIQGRRTKQGSMSDMLPTPPATPPLRHPSDSETEEEPDYHTAQTAPTPPFTPPPRKSSLPVQRADCAPVTPPSSSSTFAKRCQSCGKGLHEQSTSYSFPTTASALRARISSLLPPSSTVSTPSNYEHSRTANTSTPLSSLVLACQTTGSTSYPSSSPPNTIESTAASTPTFCSHCFSDLANLNLCWSCGLEVARSEERVRYGWALWHWGCVGCLVCRAPVRPPVWTGGEVRLEKGPCCGGCERAVKKLVMKEEGLTREALAKRGRERGAFAEGMGGGDGYRSDDEDKRLDVTFYWEEGDHAYTTDQGFEVATEYTPLPPLLSPSLSSVKSFESVGETFAVPRVRSRWQRGRHIIDTTDGSGYDDSHGYRGNPTPIFEHRMDDRGVSKNSAPTNQSMRTTTPITRVAKRKAVSPIGLARGGSVGRRGHEGVEGKVRKINLVDRAGECQRGGDAGEQFKDFEVEGAARRLPRWMVLLPGNRDVEARA